MGGALVENQFRARSQMRIRTKIAEKLGQALRTNKLAKLCEILVVCISGIAVIVCAGPFVGDNPLARHAVILIANLLVLLMLWSGLRLRNENCRHFGLSFRFENTSAVLRTIMQSVVVFVVAVAAFMAGAVLMANIVGMPEGADMTGYNYLRGNLTLLIVSLVAVYVVSSFGEEVIYRAFLINRIAELGSKTNTAWRVAVVVSSIVFGLAHFDWAIAGMVQTGCMGLALGVSYLVVGRNLWVTILAHGYMDTILIVQMYVGTE